MKRRKALAVFSAAVAAAASGALGQIRIVEVNTANSSVTSARPGMSTVLSAIGTSVSNDPTTAGSTGIAKPLDILLLQESAGEANTGASFTTMLNNLYSTNVYAHGVANGGSTGSGTQSVVYNSSVLQLVSEALIGTASTSGQPRQALRYKFHIIGYDSSSDFYVYNSHYKSASDSTSEGRREVEATAIRNDADALGANTNIIYAADFNVYTSAETFYSGILMGAGNGKAFDPINKPGAWDNSNTFHNIHTQSPYNSNTASTFAGSLSGGTGGGMDSRFDQQLISANVNDKHGFAYINDSYQCFGNNGTSLINDPINDASNTAQPKNVLDALAANLDHLPVVADYQFPAKMGVGSITLPSKVITGTSTTVTVAVSNTAPVSFSNGADTLTYSMNSSGSFSGSATNQSKLALTGANNHSVTLDTASPGNKSGTINVVSNSESVANGNFSFNGNYSVVDHSNGSFSSSGSVTSQSIDFGYVPQGFANRSATFGIANLVATPSFTADLALPSITSTGDTAALSTNASTFTHLAAGSSNTYSAGLDTTNAGNFAANHTFNVADEAIPGSTSGTPLSLNLTARVISSANFPVTGFMQLNNGETYTTGPMSIGSSVTLTKTGPGTLTISDVQSHGAGAALICAAGTTNFNTDAGSAGNQVLALSASNSGTVVNLNASQHLSSLSIDSGAAVAMPAGRDKALVANSLSINGTSTLDINDNALIVNYGAETSHATRDAIRNLLIAGRNAPPASPASWNGAGGIISSYANQNGNGFNLALGYADNTDLAAVRASGSYTSFGGETVASSAVLVQLTRGADATLDGVVDSQDVTIIGTHFNKPGSGQWCFGDFDYSGTCDSTDVTTLGTTFGKTSPSLSPAQMTAEFGAAFTQAFEAGQSGAVPEPTGLALLGISAMGLLMRRRRLSNR